MHVQQIALVALSACLHAYWNFELKRAGNPAASSWCIQALAAPLCLPIALALAWPLSVPPLGWMCVAATGSCYACYYLFISRSYATGELSRAYPIARGVGPAASALLGAALMGERPSALGAAGIASVCVGVLGMAAPQGEEGPRRIAEHSVLAAVGTGVCIAAYSVVDKMGVQIVHPALYIVLTFAAGSGLQAVALAPRLGWAALIAPIRKETCRTLSASAACGIGYLLVLIVLRRAPVSYVVPLRSMSVLIGIMIGASVLREPLTPRKATAGALIMAGICAIGLA